MAAEGEKGETAVPVEAVGDAGAAAEEAAPVRFFKAAEGFFNGLGKSFAESGAGAALEAKAKELNKSGSEALKNSALDEVGDAASAATKGVTDAAADVVEDVADEVAEAAEDAAKDTAKDVAKDPGHAAKHLEHGAEHLTEDVADAAKDEVEDKVEDAVEG
jgi:gas vesicle protein